MNFLKDSWKRWLTWLLLSVIFAVACVFLSGWQFSRRSEALVNMTRLEANYDATPIELTDHKFRAKDEWRPVSLTGRYLINKVLLVRNRPLNGAPGYLLLIPFERNDGLLIGVEAGWLPADERLNPPKTFPLPSAETQTIWGRERPNEPTLNRDAPTGQIATINLPTLFAKNNLPNQAVTEFYLSLGASNFTQHGLPKLLSKPEITEGNHLSYALQWIVFALMAFSALTWAVRQEMRFKRMAADPNYKPKIRKQVGDEDKAAEDVGL